MNCDVIDLSADALLAWFAVHGGTDESYFRGSYDRFVATHEFVRHSLKPASTILDVGTHWLHQAIFFCRDGHKVIGADVPDTTERFEVRKVAEALGVDLISYRRLEEGEGLDRLPESSVDAILFCEIIEHITFNPVKMWREFYRILRPGGRIFITTPNSLFYERILHKLKALFDRFEYGISTREILEYCTYGHHWKEYSAIELRTYFGCLSPDLEVTRLEAVTTYQTPEVVQFAYQEHLKRDAMIGGMIPFQPLVQRLEVMGAMPFGQQLLCEVTLNCKERGIVVDPGWKME